MIKNICGDLPIDNQLSKWSRKKKIRVYEMNKELSFDLFSLTKLKSPYLKNYYTELIKKFTSIEAEIEPPKNCENFQRLSRSQRVRNR